MNEPEQQNQGGLVPAGSSALTTRSSGLVKRGLELIRDQNQKRRKIRILIGNSQNEITEVIVDTIEWAGSGKYELVMTYTDKAQQILEYARSQEFDLCLVILNNLWYLPRDSWPTGFVEKYLELVRQLKRIARFPIIAGAGDPRDRLSLPEETERAGADHFFWLPFPVPEFVEAVKQCLAEKPSSMLNR